MCRLLSDSAARGDAPLPTYRPRPTPVPDVAERWRIIKAKVKRQKAKVKTKDSASLISDRREPRCLSPSFAFCLFTFAFPCSVSYSDKPFHLGSSCSGGL